MEYLDFELRIAAGGDGRYPVVARSGDQVAHAALSLDPESDDLVRVRALVEEARGQTESEPRPDIESDPRPGRGIKLGGSPPSRRRTLVEELEEFGQSLFTSLIQGDVRDLYETCQREAREPARIGEHLVADQSSEAVKKGVRLRLIVEAPDLAVLPWELLFDPDLDDFVCLRAETPLVRHLELKWSAGALTTEPPLRVLAMIGDHRGLDVEREVAHMEIAVEHLVERGDLELTWLDGHTARALEGELDRRGCHVFHFIGHGSFDEDRGEGVLWLEPEAFDGAEPERVERLGAQAFSRLLVDHVDHDPPRLAVLNACEGAKGSQRDLFSSIGAKLAREIPAVVSMQYEISDRAAIEFSRRFYEALVKGLPVDVAVTEARKAISIYLSETAEWATPVLHMRSPDGRLFAVDYAGAIHRVSRADDAPLTGDAPRAELLGLVEKVREAWIRGVLDQSVWDFARVDPAVAAAFPEGIDGLWEAILEPRDGSSSTPEKTILDLFDAHQGSLLLLGEPGSGKTTRLLQLTRDLLDRAREGPGRRVPVVFQLGSWNRPEIGFAEWMAGELAEKYQLPRRDGRRWLKEGYLVPMLDGLDEVREDLRADCVEAINAYGRLVGARTMVVSCRLKEYLALPNRLQLEGALRLQPLGRDRLVRQIRAVGPPLQALAELLETDDSGLLIEAQRPLMLSLMIHAYWNRTERELRIEGPHGAAARRNHIMKAYVAHMFSRRGPGAAGG